MKKLFLAVLMAAIIVPFMSFAETTDSVQGELEAILAQKAELEQELISVNRQERDLRLKLSRLKHSNTGEVLATEPREEAVVATTFGVPVITKPLDGEIIPLTVDMVKVEGTAPEGAQKIIVNGYALTKFIPGNKT